MPVNAGRFPVILRAAPLPDEGLGEVQPLVQMTAIMQMQGPHGQPYYPFLFFRVTRPLLVRAVHAQRCPVHENQIGALAAVLCNLCDLCMTWQISMICRWAMRS